MANITHEGIVTIACSWTFALLALLSLWAIYLARRREAGIVRSEDLLVYFAFLCSVVLTSITTWAVLREGLYQHLNSVPYSEMELIAKSLVANEALWSLVNTCFRVAACCFNRKIFSFSPTSTVMVAMIVLSVLHFLAALLGGFLICRPVSKSWNPAVQGQCGNEFAAYLSFEIIGLALDITIILWPLKDIINLKLPFRRKAGILFIFTVGILIVIITGLHMKGLTTVDFQDWSYSKGYLGLLSALGSYSSVFLCVVPAIPRMFRNFKERMAERRVDKAKRRETTEKLRSLGLKFSKQAIADPELSAILKEEAIDQEEEISLDDVVMWSNLEAF
ncbi:uncharacterized protein BDR25DRAFT_297963 [Lindgomyces ingoldianus]|uniref:Uncharacterized protein n=1 Tax=Lindgomyces ingoldianus TaxID=673940 RepID=A0ACB6Q963_9PLEO|nr:uncharacterized protein BDR25DRAFT_297963 [Lindgomyces ingoldianus]KAF2463436.1 hypothetical protein BDR25DRAFT_297963 [Lindgomyces ingoldianus]